MHAERPRLFRHAFGRLRGEMKMNRHTTSITLHVVVRPCAMSNAAPILCQGVSLCVDHPPPPWSSTHWPMSKRRASASSPARPAPRIRDFDGSDADFTKVLPHPLLPSRQQRTSEEWRWVPCR